ncbi:MAG TPA: fused MFS/spermidine synthase [Methylomirabilota bacterium]|jgi:MFS family permease|nr:fused MFS/spermidine synthase [Methylomirabilota bacterium]
MKKRPRQGPDDHPGGGLWPRVWPLLVAFLSGWVIMMLEILGGRVLAPYFGYSVYQWGALIGVVMAALAGGYFLGGRVGDTPYALRFLLGALVVSSLYVFLVPPLGTSLLPYVRRYGPAWGAVVGSAVLLGLPSVLLAVVSPIVVRLTLTTRIADTAGRVYAVSTLGSIAGTFFTAFYAIPVLGTRASHYVAGTLLALAGVTLAVAWRRFGYGVAAALLLVSWALPAPPPAPGIIFEDESIHNIIQVVDQPAARYLYLNYQDGPQTVMLKDSVLVGSYYDYFLLGPLMNGGRKVLFLGAAGGTSVKQLVTVYPDVEVVGVELDGKVIEVAKKFFGLDGHPRVRLVEQDARFYLESARERYDVIDIDLYVTGHVPFFCTTREFFQLAKDRLTERGLVMMNVLSIQAGDDLIAPFVRTVQSVFPSVFLIGNGNFILIASKAPVEEAGLRRLLETAPAPATAREVANRAVASFRAAVAGPEWPIFTDDRNDVEFRTFKMFYGQY